MHKIGRLCFCCVLGSFLAATSVFSHKKTAAAESVNKDKSESAQAFVQNLGDKAIKIINGSGKTADEITNDFTEIVKNYFSVNQIAKFVLGRHAKSLKKDQKEIFLSCFTNMMVRLYASNFAEYKTAEFIVVGHKEKSKNQFIIESRILIKGKQDTLISWHVSCENDGKFRIHDAVINEISLKQILHAEVFGNISEKGLKKFLEEFEKKYKK
jgi:ABC-type transporter MlaC component